MENEQSNECITINLDNISPLTLEKINTNKSGANLPNSIECPICFENINADDALLILDCCHKKVHIECILEWYSKYPNNKTCFMCNQTNNFCKDLVYEGENYETVSETIQVDNSPIIQIDNTHQPEIYNRRKVAIVRTSCSLLVLSCLICWGIINIMK